MNSRDLLTAARRVSDADIFTILPSRYRAATFTTVTTATTATETLKMISRRLTLKSAPSFWSVSIPESCHRRVRSIIPATATPKTAADAAVPITMMITLLFASIPNTSWSHTKADATVPVRLMIVGRYSKEIVVT